MSTARSTLLGLIGLLAGLAAAGWSWSAEPEDGRPAHWQQVQDLASPVFTVRRRAERELRALGMQARPALLQASKAADLELRLAAYHTLLQVEQDFFERFMDEFLRSGKANGQLPAWKEFRGQVGNTATTRQLYLDLLRTEPELLGTLANNTTKASWRFAQRLEQLSTNRMFGGYATGINRATLIALLFADVEIQSHLRPDAYESYSSVNSRLFYLLTLPQTAPLVSQGKYSDVARELMIKWLRAEVKRGNGSSPMQLALKYELADPGRELARKVLDHPGSSTSSVPYAAIALARFGNKSDVRRLLPHLDNDYVFHTWTNPKFKNGPCKIQVRDVVLVCMLHLLEEDPRKFGFELLENYSETLYRIWTFGFETDEKRDDAFQRWTAWYRDHQQELPPESNDEKAPPEAPDKDSSGTTSPAPDKKRPKEKSPNK